MLSALAAAPRQGRALFVRDRRATCSTSCAGRLRGGAGRLLRHHLRADRCGRRRLLAVPGRRTIRGRRVSSPTAFRHRAAGPASTACRIRRRPTIWTPHIPLYLTTGRVLAHYQSGTQTRHVDELQRAARRAARGDSSGDREAARRRRRSAREADDTTRRPRRFAVKISAATSAKTPCSCRSTGAARSPINRLTSPALDPVSRMPEFKVCAVVAPPRAEDAE